MATKIKVDLKSDNVDREQCDIDICTIPNIVSTLRTNFYATAPSSHSYRISQLRQLLKFFHECEDELIDACIYNFGGGKMEHWLTRIWIIKHDIYNTIANLTNWMKAVKKPQNFPLNVVWSAFVEYHPYGVTAIIAPWNFPLVLLFRPLIGAIAAGNAVILKPSEITNKVASVINNQLLNYLDPKMIQIVCGGAQQTTVLLQQKLDFVMFTGSTSIGKLVMKLCAEHLTPCCLELGGKNPVIIDDDSDLDISLKRIIYGKFCINTGQICVAPEMIFISKHRQKEAIEILRKHLLDFYGNNGDTLNSNSYNNIVNNRHFERINNIRSYYLKEHPDKVAIGGVNDEAFGAKKVDKQIRHLPPMVLCDIDKNDDKVMETEVFGPILSIIPMEGTIKQWRDDVIQYISAKGKPLVCYLFTRDPASDIMKKFRNSISAGAICINDTFTYMGLNGLPFGGVGESGMGQYGAGGESSFKTFSHKKPVAIRSHAMEFVEKQRYPAPNKDIEQLKKTKRMMESLYNKPASTLKKVVKYSVIIGACVGFAYWVRVRRRLYNDLKRVA